jgi:hypothetical protein
VPPRPEVRAAPSPARRLRGAADGAPAVVVVHPGALAPDVYDALAHALPEDVGLGVLSLDGLPEYWEPALTGDRPATTVELLAARLNALLPEQVNGRSSGPGAGPAAGQSAQNTENGGDP